MTGVPTSAQDTLSIEIGNPTGTPYKSIQHVIWKDVPSFAVLTGLNGSGKSQFLYVLAHRLSGVRAHNNLPLDHMPVAIAPGAKTPVEIAYLPSGEQSFGVESSSIGNLTQMKRNFLQQIAPANTLHNIDSRIMAARVKREFGIHVPDQNKITTEMIKALPNDFLFLLGYMDVARSISHVFMAYQARVAQAHMERKNPSEIEELKTPRGNS